MKTIKVDNRENFTEIIYKEKYVHKKEEYTSLLNRIINAFNKLEYLSVLENVRDAHLTFIKPSDMASKINYFSRYGLSVVPLNKERDNGGKYGNHSLPYDGSEMFTWRSIITKPQYVDDWNQIWNIREKDVFTGEYLIGRALGYPHCCSEYFTDIWMKRGGIDTTWQQAACTVTKTSNYTEAEKIIGDCNAIYLPDNTSILTSNLLRWAGPRIVSHLPCSFNCLETKKIALQNLILSSKYEFSDEYYKMCQMLNWEITWTAECGVATIETPVFIIKTATDMTDIPYKVIKKGHNNCVL